MTKEELLYKINTDISIQMYDTISALQNAKSLLKGLESEYDYAYKALKVAKDNMCNSAGTEFFASYENEYINAWEHLGEIKVKLEDATAAMLALEAQKQEKYLEVQAKVTEHYKEELAQVLQEEMV